MKLSSSNLFCHTVSVVAALVIFSASAFGQSSIELPEFLLESAPKAQIMVFGTFHFKDAGHDSYKSEYDIDILSQQRQNELQEVIQLLSKFRPTKIALEKDTHKQGKYDSLYNQWLTGNFELKSNEVFQLGFRLAKMFGHKQIFLVDVDGRSYAPEMTKEQYDKQVSDLKRNDLGIDQWNERYRKLYQYEDSIKMAIDLRTFFLFLNSPERIRKGHGHYFVDNFKLGNGNNYFGPDMATRWYNRNLRIFSNIQRITESKEDRILLIIGAGHVPILRHAIESSPEYDLVEVSEFLNKPGKE